MRKLLSFLAVLGTLSYQSMAAFSPVTHTSGTTTIGGLNVTVASVGTVATPQNYCGTGPYYVGVTAAGGYHYTFGTTATGAGVTHIKLTLTDFHQSDTLEVFTSYTDPTTNTPLRLNSAIPGCFTGNTCVASIGPALCNVAVVGPGTIKNKFTNVGNPAGNGTGTITFSSTPGYLTDLYIIHHRRSGTSSGAIYGLEFDIDTCNQELIATVDSPYCSGRELKLHASQFPNSTITWKQYNGTTLTPFTSTSFDPVIPAAVFTGNKDYYIATVTRGSCTYEDTAAIDVELTPNATINFKGPKCTGDEDTVTVNASIGLGGEIWIIKPDGSRIKPNLPPTFNYIRLPNIQTTDAGIYRGYAIGNTGCVSDTQQVVVSLNPVVEANFTFDQKLGCDEDSVQFNDLSLGNNTWRWEFGDGNTINGTDPNIYQNPLHIYSSQGTYDVELYVTNNLCADSMTRTIILSHPLSADFEMSVDSVCQGIQVDFTNKSEATPATSPNYLWDFKDGSTDVSFNTSHIFQNYGTYYVTMTITDYLGCSRTHTDTLMVDSLGSASFFSDTVICNGENINFLGDYSLIGGTYAEWNFGDGHTIQDKFTIEHAFDNPGVYDVQLTANYRICPDTTFHQNIYVNAYPVVNLGPDTSICPQGAPVMLKDLVNDYGTPGFKWRWNTETMDSTSAIYARHPGLYSVSVEKDGCVTTDTIEVKKNCYIDIPNVFTPNNDGYNDYFLPRQFLSRNVSRFTMSIYNRWGEIVFETNNINGRGWDGKVNDKEQPTGVYIYLIKVSFANGTNENYQGNVTLMR